LPVGWSATCDASSTTFIITSPTPACNDIATSSLPADWQYQCSYPRYVYLSLPSESPTCDGIDLPTLPDAWQYRCAPEASYKNANGTGWLPLDLSTHGLSLLPIDPSNNASTTSYYVFTTDPTNTGSYVLSASLDALKYTTDGNRGTYTKGDTALLPSAR
jgi:hypothetical protein